jgi:hypothetical protein
MARQLNRELVMRYVELVGLERQVGSLMWRDADFMVYMGINKVLMML